MSVHLNPRDFAVDLLGEGRRRLQRRGRIQVLFRVASDCQFHESGSGRSSCGFPGGKKMVSKQLRIGRGVLSSLMLMGIVSCAVGVVETPVRAEEDYTSLLLPTPEEETSAAEKTEDVSSSSSANQTEEKIKRPSFLTGESARPSLVNPEQLLYERAARAARAREARIAAKKWYGISTGRPSYGWTNSHYSVGFVHPWTTSLGGYYGPYIPYGYYPGITTYGVRSPYGL